MNESTGKLLIGGIVVLAAILLVRADRLALAQAEGTPEAKNQAGTETKPGPPGAQDRATAADLLVPTTDPIAMLKRGGPVMWVLTFCSVIGVAFVLERMAALRRSRVIPRPFVSRFLQQVREGDLDRERAMAVCQDNPAPIAAIFAGAARKWGRPAVEVEQAIIDAGERVTFELRRYLRVFTALSVIGPLLGLLGTVIGMIHAFNAVAEEASRGAAVSERLSVGISEALLNTAFGLIIAIPAQSFYLYFVSRADRLIIEMDGFGQDLVHMISAEEIQNRGELQSKARRPIRKEPTV